MITRAVFTRTALAGAFALALVPASTARAQGEAPAAAVTGVAAEAEERKRPKLAKGADPNDWRSYYQAGVKAIDRYPRTAYDAFWWSARYNPGGAEPLFGMWAARWMDDKRLLQQVLEGAEYAYRDPKALSIDSLRLRALELDPFVNQQLSMVLWNTMPGEWGQDPETQGWLAYAEARLEDAARHFADAAKPQKRRGKQVDPPLRVHYQRALILHALQRHDSAARELETLVARRRAMTAKETSAIYETVSLYELGVGTAWARANRLDLAKAALERALAEDLSLVSAHVALGRLAMAQGDFATAQDEFQLAVELRPESSAPLLELGVALQRRKDFAGAVKAYERAIALEPWHAAPYFNVALAQGELGQAAEAKRRYTEFLARAPRVMVEQIAWAEGKLR